MNLSKSLRRAYLCWLDNWIRASTKLELLGVVCSDSFNLNCPRKKSDELGPQSVKVY